MKFIIEFSSMCPLVVPLFRWPVEKYQIFSCVYVYVMFVTFVLLDFPFKSSSTNISNHLPPYPFSLTILFLFFTFSDNKTLKSAHAQPQRTLFFPLQFKEYELKGVTKNTNDIWYRIIEQFGRIDIKFEQMVGLFAIHNHINKPSKLWKQWNSGLFSSYYSIWKTLVMPFDYIVSIPFSK